MQNLLIMVLFFAFHENLSTFGIVGSNNHDEYDPYQSNDIRQGSGSGSFQQSFPNQFQTSQPVNQQPNHQNWQNQQKQGTCSLTRF